MKFGRQVFKSMPVSTEIITSDDDRMENYREDTMYKGSPDALLVARDEKEITDALAFCNKNKIPMTICGSRTSMTGASIPDEGLLVSTEKLEGVTDIFERDGKTFAKVRPGTIIADLQKAIADAGYFYPVAPTSRDDCRIGSNVSTNATGEDSYKYGPVRNYVHAIELMTPDGRTLQLSRAGGESPSWERNKAGYFIDWKNPIDLVIGSEGTLGFIRSVTLALLPKAMDFFSGLIPFDSNRKALDFAIHMAMDKKGLRPRTLELVDEGALKMMKTALGFPKISDEIKAFLYIKQEYQGDDERSSLLMKWYDIISARASQKMADAAIIATTAREKEDFRKWRHRVPEAANEYGRKYWPVGGGKVGSDWWAPIPRLKEMMEYFYGLADATGLPYMGYAHIGSGHPHTNILTTNPDEKRRAKDVLLACCKKAVSLGGGVAGEHGIGKIHRDLVPVQYPADVINKMKAWKREYDPNWILGKGNIFE
jgi:FAD/FMN-containing dehydrogenase